MLKCRRGPPATKREDPPDKHPEHDVPGEDAVLDDADGQDDLGDPRDPPVHDDGDDEDLVEVCAVSA